MRVYIPTTLAGLGAALGSGTLPGGRAYAVTAGLRAWVEASGDGHRRAGSGDMATARSATGSDPAAPGPNGSDDADEELEFVALSEAARQCLRILAGSAPPPGAIGQDSSSVGPAVRVVLVADVPDSAVAVGDAEPGEVELIEPVPMRLVASAHVDGDGSMPAVVAAVGAIGAADAGDQVAESVVDTVDDLLWYAPQELAGLIDQG